MVWSTESKIVETILRFTQNGLFQMEQLRYHACVRFYVTKQTVYPEPSSGEDQKVRVLTHSGSLHESNQSGDGI